MKNFMQSVAQVFIIMLIFPLQKQTRISMSQLHMMRFAVAKLTFSGRRLFLQLAVAIRYDHTRGQPR